LLLPQGLGVRVSICRRLTRSYYSIQTGESIHDNPPQDLFFVPKLLKHFVSCSENVEIRAGTRKETYRPSDVCTALAKPVLFASIDL
jgi:hypothetical protein